MLILLFATFFCVAFSFELLDKLINFGFRNFPWPIDLKR